MGEKKVRTRLYKLIAAILLTCVSIYGVLRYVSLSVADLYLTSIYDRMEEQAIQYANSFHFKLQADLQTLRAMAGMLQDHQDQEPQELLLSLQGACNASQFIRLGYFEEDGSGYRLTFREEGVVPVALDQLPTELQDVVAKAWAGSSAYSQAFYDSHLDAKVLASATPVYSHEQICGVLVSAVETDVYAQILSSIKAVSPLGTAAIIYNSGNVVASTRVYSLSGFYNLFDSTYLSDEIKAQYGACFADPEVSFFQFVYQGDTYYNCVLPLDTLPGASIVITDTGHGISNAVSGVVRMAYTMVALFALASVAVILAALWMLRRYRADLSQVAYFDRLTGAYNKAKFLLLLEEKLDQPWPCAVVSINIRKFKYRNELFGSADSDLLLKEISDLLRQHIRPGEFFCRDTADRFLLCLKEAEESAVKVRLHALFVHTDQMAGTMHPNYPLYFYCGCAFRADCAGEDPQQELMSHVMMALGIAKQGHQTTISFYNAQLHKQETMQNYMENHMEQALHEGSFHLFLQPKIRLEDGALGGAEALVRWMYNGVAIFSPDQFIPLFEHNGFCVKLDYYMVEQVCRQIRAWLDQGLPLVPISVNQTRLLFHQKNYPQRLRDIAAAYQIPPAALPWRFWRVWPWRTWSWCSTVWRSCTATASASPWTISAPAIPP